MNPESNLKNLWQEYQYLALDEMLMLAQDILARLSNISVGKKSKEDMSFGGNKRFI